MSEIIIAVLSLAGTLLVAEPILFYSIYRKLRKTKVTDANADNSLKLIEVQDKYIDLIDDKDRVIRDLNDRLLSARETIIYYQTLHCEDISCPKRRPPLGGLLKPQEGKVKFLGDGHKPDFHKVNEEEINEVEE